MQVPDTLPHLSQGAHPAGSGELCAMEAASWLSGQKQTDHPSCVDHWLANFLRGANDRLDDESRQKLWGYIYRSLDTVLYPWALDSAQRLDALQWQHRAEELTVKFNNNPRTSAEVFCVLDLVFNEYERITHRTTSTVPQRSNLVGANT